MKWPFKKVQCEESLESHKSLKSLKSDKVVYTTGKDNAK